MIEYTITYRVEAVSLIDAVTKAVGLLRTDVRFRGVFTSEDEGNGWWSVSLKVDEDAAA